MDSPPPPDDGPGLPKAPNAHGTGLWPPGVEAEVDQWLRSGIYPFPELGIRNPTLFRGLGKFEARLFDHNSAIYRDLQR